MYFLYLSLEEKSSFDVLSIAISVLFVSVVVNPPEPIKFVLYSECLELEIFPPWNGVLT